MSAKKTAKPAAAPKKAAAKKAEPKKAAASSLVLSPEEQTKADALTELGEVREVRFGLIRGDCQVRRIRSKEAQEENKASVLEGKLQERMTVFEDENGFFQTISGETRRLSLVAAGYSPDAMISVVVKPRPSSTVDLVMLGAKANVHSRMVWPDLANVIGVATGVIDDEGKPTKIANLSERLAAEKGLRTSAQVAKELGLAQVTVNTYQRIARAPYDDLVKIYEAGGSIAHGDRYAAYADKDKPEALAHYLKFQEWPETVQPQRRRAEKTPPKKAEKNGAAPEVQASLTGKGKQRPAAAKADAQTTWTSGGASEDKAEPSAVPSTIHPAADNAAKAMAHHTSSPTETKIRTILEGNQVSFLSEPSTPAPAPSPAPRGAEDPDRRKRQPGELEEVADHFGIPLELARLIDAAIDHWPHARLELAYASDVEAMERAVQAYMAASS